MKCKAYSLIKTHVCLSEVWPDKKRRDPNFLLMVHVTAARMTYMKLTTEKPAYKQWNQPNSPQNKELGLIIVAMHVYATRQW